MKRAKSVAVSAAMCVCAAALARGDEAVIGGPALASVWEAASAGGRVDVVCIGDSNQLFFGTGWDEGWARALHEQFGLYATGLHSAGESNGVNSGVGWTWGTTATVGTSFAYNGAAAGAAELLNNPPSGLVPLNYLFVAEGEQAPWQSASGMWLGAESAISVNWALRFHATVGAFGGEGAGSFTACVRRNQSPWTVLTTATASTRHAGAGVQALHLAMDLPAAERNFPLALRFSIPGGAPVVGPFIAYYQRIEARDRAGASLHTMYGFGGQSARDMGAALLASTDATLRLYFDRVRALQGEQKRVVVRINTGLNDRQENLPSLVTGITPADSPAAFRENLQAIIDRVRGVWQSAGWPEEELHFLLTVSHPVGNDVEPDDPELLAYREEAKTLTILNQRTASVRLDRLTTPAEMLANGWYRSALDPNHLSPSGYAELSRRELLALLDASQPPACPTDINGDDGVDDLDIVLFFALFEAGEMDFNGDEGVDDLDIVLFFDMFEAGC